MKSFAMIGMPRTAAIAFVALVGLVANGPAAHGGELDGGLVDVLAEVRADEVVSSLVFLWDQVDVQQLTAALDAERASRSRRHSEVIRTLRDTASLAQRDLRAQLTALEAAGLVHNVQPFWLANCVRVDATAAILEQLARRDDVMRVYFNAAIEGPDPIVHAAVREVAGRTSGIEPGIQAIRADEVWNMGLTGEGVLVAAFDTGVDGNHEAVGSRWRGHVPQYAGHPEWAWFDPHTNTTSPQDFGLVSHGTHTTGTMCGGAPGDSVGVAPGAEWIHAAVLDRYNTATTIADSILAFQWIVDPDGNPDTSWDVPDVCSHSWSIGDHGLPECDETFWSYIDNAEAAGVIMFFAAGNWGEGGLHRPGERATDEYRSAAVASLEPRKPPQRLSQHEPRPWVGRSAVRSGS